MERASDILQSLSRKPVGRETRSDGFVEAIADAVADRLQHIQYRTKRLFSLEEAAEYLGLSEDAVRDLVNQGKLKPVRPTRKLQFDICDLDEFIKGLKKD
jgi:excisionase family DNA binding protein